jgi:NADH/F420H2 dehydrogenase subunit C
MNIEQQVEKIKSVFTGPKELSVEYDRVCCPIFWVKSEHLLELLKFLRDSEGLEYRFMADLTAYDEQGSSEENLSRFVMVYNLFSPQHKTRVRIKLRVKEHDSVPSAVGVWPAANWAEREVFDMYGIQFDGHPDLRRILMDIRWEGHPLRKDYPLRKYQLFNDPEKIPQHLLED